ncbi:MAG: aminotransferase class V-fold PLP-dependent enzyme [Coriobacteriales bacterium]|nr:aminotransferase class V-fold PLP-dependent enzyme [Coriobacteriales bacterium]
MFKRLWSSFLMGALALVLITGCSNGAQTSNASAASSATEATSNTSAASQTSSSFDATSDELLNDVAARGQDLHDYQLGYPVNEDLQLQEFYDWYRASGLDKVMLNNAGDPNDSSSTDHGALAVEGEVIKFFAPLYGFSANNVWGLVTASGTDGNNHGIYFGRNYLVSKTQLEPILYVSTESHYSNMRLAELQQMETKLIPTDEMGRMNPDELKKALDPTRPALVVYSMGTTFKGGVDDQAALNKIIDEANLPAVYRHVDAALFGGYLPFSEYKDLVNKQVCGFDSIAISGHKFFGIDEPCGLFFTTKDVMDQQNPNEVSYLNGSMPMINCSRSATNPLKFYWLIKTKGVEGFTQQTTSMLENTTYLKSKLDEIGWPAWVSCKESNTVFFKRPSDATMKKYSLAPDKDDRFGGDLAHVTVMQNASRDLIDKLIADLQAELKTSAEELQPAA